MVQPPTETFSIELPNTESTGILFFHCRNGRLKNLHYTVASPVSFDRQPPTYVHLEHTTDHGRVGKREYALLGDLKRLDISSDWAGLQTLVRVCCVVFSLSLWKTTQQTRYYISSIQLVDQEKDSRTIVHAIRSHLGIEVSLHWSLDVSFSEDDCRIRKGYADQNLSAVRKLALNLLRHEPTVKRGLKTKRMKEGWDDAYLKALLRV